MQDLEDVAVFWDFDGTRSASDISGCDIAKNIRITGQIFGTVKSFRCYYDFSALNSLRIPSLRPELQASGVSLVDCPSTTIASKMMLVDLITHALDHPAPTTFLIITGDKDFSYAIAILRMRKYRVVLLSPPGSHSDLTRQASVNVDWNKAVLELGDEDDITVNPDVPPPATQTHRPRSQSFAPPLVPEHQESLEDPINIEARNRSRRNSLFSKPLYDPERYNIFGDPYNPPKLPNLSDGFSRPQWQSPLRADSAPPMASYVNGGMSTHETGRTPGGTGRHTPPDPLASYSAWAEKGKGKQREFPFPQPDDVTPFAQTAIPAFRRSSLNHSDTDTAGREQVHPLRHSPLTSVRQSSPYRGQVHASPHSVKTLSSSSSGSSAFSMVAPPTSTGPTSEPPSQEKENKVFASTDSAVAPTYTPPAQSVPGMLMAPQQESMPQPATVPVPPANTTAVDGTATPVTVATTATPAASTTLPATALTTAPAASSTTAASWHIPGKPAVIPSVSKPANSSPKVTPSMPSAGPSTMPSASPSTNVQLGSSKLPVPQKFRTLVDRIRYYKSQGFPNRVPRSVLGADLPQLEKGIYEKANVSKFAAYIEAARVAGVVTIGTNQKGEGVICLRSPWPFVD